MKMINGKMTKILTKKKKDSKKHYAKDIKLYKDGHEIIINETQLDNFLELGYKQQQENKQTKSNKDKKWQHITEKKES